MFYTIVYTCDEGFYTSIKENGQLNCKGEKFNKKLSNLQLHPDGTWLLLINAVMHLKNVI